MRRPLRTTIVDGKEKIIVNTVDRAKIKTLQRRASYLDDRIHSRNYQYEASHDAIELAALDFALDVIKQTTVTPADAADKGGTPDEPRPKTRH